MKEGICVFSGHEVPKGTGLTRVLNDTRTLLFMNRKVRALSARKAKPRALKWTQSSRLFYKKGAKKVVQKETKIRVFKEVRGFPSVPKSLVKKKPAAEKKRPEGEALHQRRKKVTKADKRKKW